MYVFYMCVCLCVCVCARKLCIVEQGHRQCIKCSAHTIYTNGVLYYTVGMLITNNNVISTPQSIIIPHFL